MSTLKDTLRIQQTIVALRQAQFLRAQQTARDAQCAVDAIKSRQQTTAQAQTAATARWYALTKGANFDLTGSSSWQHHLGDLGAREVKLTDEMTVARQDLDDARLLAAMASATEQASMHMVKTSTKRLQRQSDAQTVARLEDRSAWLGVTP